MSDIIFLSSPRICELDLVILNFFSLYLGTGSYPKLWQITLVNPLINHILLKLNNQHMNIMVYRSEQNFKSLYNMN